MNRHTVKDSYKCTKNVKNVIQSHNSKVLKGPQQQADVPQCNCRRNCPLPGSCRVKNVVYRATVKSGSEVETYTGLTGQEFKKRHSSHTHDFKYSQKRKSTTLSDHILTLKDRSKNFEVEWKILKNCQPYNPAANSCHLCLNEKLHILTHPEDSSLNKRSDFLKLPHKRGRTLGCLLLLCSNYLLS